MADEYRYLDPGATSLTNLNGSVEDTHEDPYAAQSAWLEATGGGDSTEVDGTFHAPSGGLDGEQEFQVLVRSTSNGNGGAEVTIELDDSSTPVSGYSLGSGETVVFDAADGLTLDAASTSTPTSITINGTQGGGMPGGRDTVEVGAVRWAVELDQTLSVQTQAATDIGTDTATFNGDLVFAGYEGDADVWFEWGEVGTGFPNTTPTQSYDAGTAFSETVSVDPDTEYEYQAQTSHTEAGSDTGSVVSFWSPFEVSGTVSAGGSPINGATVYIVSDAFFEEVPTAGDGSYSVVVPGGETYHVAAQHDDGSTEYAGESYPGVGY